MRWILTTNFIFYNFRSAHNFLASEVTDFLREHDINNNRWELIYRLFCSTCWGFWGRKYDMFVFFHASLIHILNIIYMHPCLKRYFWSFILIKIVIMFLDQEPFSTCLKAHNFFFSDWLDWCHFSASCSHERKMFFEEKEWNYFSSPWLYERFNMLKRIIIEILQE